MWVLIVEGPPSNIEHPISKKCIMELNTHFVFVYNKYTAELETVVKQNIYIPLANNLWRLLYRCSSSRLFDQICELEEGMKSKCLLL